MSRKIIGVTVGTTMPKPNFDQTDPSKGDYIRGDRAFITPDDTLTQVGRPADAKATRDAINQVQTSIDEVTGVISNLDNRYYTEAEIDSMMADFDAAITSKSDSDHIHDDLYYTETEIDAKLGAMQSDIDSKVDAEDGKGLSTEDYTTGERDKLASIEAEANKYEHPPYTSYTSHNSDLYKITVNEFGHISSMKAASKEDIVALGIPGEDTKYDTEISDLNDRIDDVESDINTTNETLNGVSQELESYKTTNNEAVLTNASGIEANKTAIEEIQDDYLKSTDKTQLQDDITEVSNAIEILNGEGEGSVKRSIDNAFNEFAATISNDGYVNTYKELIDYVDDHGAEFAELVGVVSGINTRVGDVETDFDSYKTVVSGQFDEVNTAISDNVNEIQKSLDEKANLEHAHSDLYYDKDEIEELVTVEDIDDICGSNVIIDGGNSSVVSYATKQWVQDGYQPKGNYLTSVPDGYATESYVNTKIAAIPTPDVSGQINTHNIATDAHNDIRLLIEGLTTRLNALADCDDTTLDQMSEVVEYIKSNQSLIEGVTTKKVNVADIVNNLTTNVTNKPLSAAQGVVIKALIDALDTDKLDASSLTSAINDALAQAKASGEFKGEDGQDGYTPIKGVDYFDGKDGQDGITPHIGNNGNWFIGETDTGTPANGSNGNSVFYCSRTSGTDAYGFDLFYYSDIETNNKEIQVGDNILCADGYMYNVTNVYDVACSGICLHKWIGSDGVSATHSWDGTTLTITSASGTSSVDLKGDKGDTYNLTESDITEIAEQAAKLVNIEPIITDAEIEQLNSAIQ